MSRIFDEPNDRAVIESNSLPFILPNLLEPQIAHCEEISSRYKDVLENKLNPGDYRFMKLLEISHDTKQPQRRAMETILTSMNSPEFNTVYLILGKKDRVSIYFGVVKNLFHSEATKFTAYDSSRFLKSAIRGSFNGSILNDIASAEEEIFQQLGSFKRAGVIFGTPTLSEEQTKEDIDFQGVDRLINSMMGEEWGFIVVCEPLPTHQINGMLDRAYDLYNKVHPSAKTQVQISTNVGESEQSTTGKSETRTKTDGVNESSSTSRGKSQSYGENSKNSGSSQTKGISSSISIANGESSQESRSFNTGKGESHSKEFIDKKQQEILKYIDEELLERLNYGRNKGLYKTSVYTLARDNATQTRLQRMIVSVFQGNDLSFTPLRILSMVSNDKESGFLKLISSMQIFDVAAGYNEYESLMSSRVQNGDMLSFSTYLTSRELSLYVSVPTKEIPGVALKKAVSFGLNIPCQALDTRDSIPMGCLIDNGRKLENHTIHLNKTDLNKHVFITGVTGSGKTTTCLKLLNEAKVPFLVIEPAKTEYRKLWKQDKTLKLYTLGNETGIPFRFNPFELLEGESVSMHIDMLKATFTASFPMEAAMPQLIEDALYKIYAKFGWDIETNQNSGDTSALLPLFPKVSDFVAQLRLSIKEKGFGAELKANYEGALISRFSSFTIGVKGLMLDCCKSINIDGLLESNVVIEMEDLKDDTDKALMMGLLLARLNEALKRKHKTDKGFRHITLIEEAHRLLSKYEYGDSPCKRQGVTVFTDMLAEVRKYGESLIIVDQIPNKLTPEVLKNTNTKIIHKIFAKDDKDSVGDTMSMDEEQRNYLSNLNTGEAIMFSQGWSKPVWIMIEPSIATTSLSDEDDISDIELQVIRKKQLESDIQAYLPYPFISNKYPYEEIPKLKKLISDWVNDFEIKPHIDEAWCVCSIQSYSKLVDELARFCTQEQTAAIAAITYMNWRFGISDRDIHLFTDIRDALTLLGTDKTPYEAIVKSLTELYTKHKDKFRG